MAVTTTNPKPFTCQDCHKGFVSLDKLNHHQHKLHGAPRQLTVSISAAPMLSGNQGDETPTPQLFQDGELTGIMNELANAPATSDTTARLLSDYQLTPSIFDQDFRDSLATLAGKAVSPAILANVGKPKLRSSPRIQAMRQNSQENGMKKELPFQFSSPNYGSPSAVLGQYLAPANQNIPQINPAGNPNVPVAPRFILTQENVLQGGLLSGQAVQHGASNAMQLQEQLRTLWAYSRNELAFTDRDVATPSLRDTFTPKPESLCSGREGSVKRKFDDIDSEISDAISVISSSERSTPGRRSKAILETSDPVLADKRRRNRVAAEKCREKRKAKQRNLEVENDELREQIKVLKGRYDSLAQVSQEAVNNLQIENTALRAENQQLRNAMGGSIPVPVPNSSRPSNPGGDGEDLRFYCCGRRSRSLWRGCDVKVVCFDCGEELKLR